MKTLSACIAIVFSFGSPHGLAATETATSNSSSGANPYILNLRSKSPAISSTTPATSEVFQNVVIPAGKNVVLQSTLDYSASSTVAVAVLCSACTTQASSLSSAGLVLEARWQALNAGIDVATQSASIFAYFDAGGAVFNVYGERFNLELLNKGNASIVLDLITIFRRSQ